MGPDFNGRSLKLCVVVSSKQLFYFTCLDCELKIIIATAILQTSNIDDVSDKT